MTIQAKSQMNKLMWCVLFTAAYGIVVGLGMECALRLLGMSMTMSFDSVVARYPRFVPFCVIVGLLALGGLVLLLILNVNASEKLGYTKKTWAVQSVSVLVRVVPMIKLFDLLFRFLQDVF